MPTINGDRLLFGLDAAIPPTARSAWGARLIVTQDGFVDLLFDRQGCAGVQREKMLNLLARHLPPTAMIAAIGALLRSGQMDTRVAHRHIVLDNDDLMVVADTNASAGYCYVAAWPQRIRTFTGDYAEVADVFIEHETDPWVEVDGKPFDWMEYTKAHPVQPRYFVVDGEECLCNCGASPVEGTLEAMNSPFGVNRCDECSKFEGDLDAALALAQLVGGVVKFYATDKETTA